MIHFVVPSEHEFCIRDYLDVYGAPLRQDFHILHSEDLVQPKEFPRGTYVLSTLDRLNAANIELLSEIYRQLKDAPGVRFLNHPLRTLQRFDLLTELHRERLNDFRALRADANQDGLKFPVFIRNERLHDGAISPLLKSDREIEQAIGRALVQGHTMGDLLVVEFCNTASDDGYYRKYAAFIVGKKIIPRSLNLGREWMLKHSGTEFMMPMVLEELDYVRENPHRDQLSRIFELAHVEYGRIDYSIKDGRVQTWEINLNPTIGRGLRPPSVKIPPDLDAVRQQVRDCFFGAFARGWQEINLRTENDAPIEVKIPQEILSAASARTVGENRMLTATRTILRPAKPLIEPLTPPFLRLLSSIARRHHRH